MTEAEAKVKLYALRKTDFGFHGKTTERAITGGYTMPPRDESIVRNTEPKHVVFKAARGSARPHGGAPAVNASAIEAKSVTRVDRNLAEFFKAGRKAKRKAKAARRAAMGLT